MNGLSHAYKHTRGRWKHIRKAKVHDPARVGRRLYRFVFLDVVIAHLVSAFAALIWGTLLLLPGHLFATNPLFGAMARHGPESHFGCAMLILALLDLAALRVCRTLFDLTSLLAGVVLWVVVAWMVACGSPPFPIWPHWMPYATGPYIYGGLALWLGLSGLLRISPALGDDLVLWQGQRALRRAARTVETIVKATEESDRAAEESDKAQSHLDISHSDMAQKDTGR